MKAEVAKREIESLDYYLQNHTDDYSEESHTAMMMAIKALEQEPKTGHWVETDKYESYWYRCSECCRGSDDITDYCPNCGAKMESEE